MKEKAENIYDTLVTGDNTFQLVYMQLTQLVLDNQKTLLYTVIYRGKQILMKKKIIFH